MNIIEQREQEQMAKRGEARPIPEFQAGDTLRVHVKVVEGSRERVQVFEGVCIARKNNGVNSAFTVRKISYGEGVERVFPLYSPRIEEIEVVRRGSVRRAKLYYLRERRGKAARIAERTTGQVMGEAAEEMASRNGVSRLEQDEFACRSHHRAAAAAFAAAAMATGTMKG